MAVHQLLNTCSLSLFSPYAQSRCLSPTFIDLQGARASLSPASGYQSLFLNLFFLARALDKTESIIYSMYP